MRKISRRRSPLAKLVFFVVGLATLYGGYYAGNRYAPIKPEYLNLHVLATPTKVKLELIDHYKRPFNSDQLSGHWSLILFGNTQAPEQAQAGLVLVTEVKNRLAAQPELQSITRAILISVDPSVDSPERLRAFIAPFSPDYLALTGDSQQVESAAKQFGVVINKLPDKRHSGVYRINHGSSIGLVGPNGELTGLFTGVVDAVSIAADIQKIAADY